MNALFYCLWRFDVWTSLKANQIVLIITTQILKIFLIGNTRERILQRVSTNSKEYEMLLKDKRGISIGKSSYGLGYFYTNYTLAIFIVLFFYTVRHYESIGLYPTLAIASTPTFIGWIVFDRALYNKDRYPDYFKIFQKKDQRWHKRWNRITLLFCSGSILSMVLGIVAGYFIINFS